MVIFSYQLAAHTMPHIQQSEVTIVVRKLQMRDMNHASHRMRTSLCHAKIRLARSTTGGGSWAFLGNDVTNRMIMKSTKKTVGPQTLFNCEQVYFANIPVTCITQFRLTQRMGGACALDYEGDSKKHHITTKYSRLVDQGCQQISCLLYGEISRQQSFFRVVVCVSTCYFFQAFRCQ